MTSRSSSHETAFGLARGLGWFSIGLGLAELLAPRSLTRSLGMRGSEATVQAYGVREIATGIGILASGNPRPWIWGRVVGDGVDVATLLSAHRNDNPKKGNVALALAAVAGITLLDILAAEALPSGEETRRALPPDRWGALLAAYRRRSGFRQPAAAMRGAARDFAIPRDFRIPEPLRPWTSA